LIAGIYSEISLQTSEVFAGFSVLAISQFGMLTYIGYRYQLNVYHKALIENNNNIEALSET
jgi:hypothetical protein